jgi:hypothetical protein
MRVSQLTLAAIACTALYSGCAEEPSARAVTATVRDSAGITIVENRIDTARARVGWALGEAPMLTIGGLDVPESQQLFQVSGARRLDDGRIAVVDGGSAEVRVYDARGALVHAHGRKGEGPGEYQGPRLAGVLGTDTLVVYDSRLRRVSLLHPVQGFARSYLVGTEGGGFPTAIGITAEGGLAIGGGMFFSSVQGFPSGRVRPNSRYVILAPEGSVRGDFGDVPAADMFARSSGGMFQAASLPFGRRTAAAIGRDQFWLGTGDSWEVRAYTLDAQLERIVRFDRPQMRVTDALRDAYLAEQLADVDDANEARQLRERHAAMASPEMVPPYQHFAVDALQHLWIGEYVLPDQTVRTYTIVDQDGRATGRLTMPERTLPLDIGADYVLGLTRDDLDIERLTLWRLERGRRSAE